MADAISLTRRMDALLATKDMVALKAMYHPDVESFKPSGECIKGVEANFGAFEKMIVNQFPRIEIESFNFELGENKDTCAFDTLTKCNNEAIVDETGITRLAANAIYRVRKQNTFKDGLLIKVTMVTDPSAVVCRDGQV